MAVWNIKKCGEWLKTTSISLYGNARHRLRSAAQSKYMRIIGFFIGGTAFSSALNYCVGLLGTDVWIVDLNYAVTGLGFVIAGSLSYANFELNLSGLKDMRRNFRWIWSYIDHLRPTLHTINENQRTQKHDIIHIQTLLRERAKIDTLYLSVMQAIAKIHESDPNLSRLMIDIGPLLADHHGHLAEFKIEPDKVLPKLLMPDESDLHTIEQQAQRTNGEPIEMRALPNSVASPPIRVSSAPSVFFSPASLIHPLAISQDLEQGSPHESSTTADLMISNTPLSDAGANRVQREYCGIQ